MNGVALLEADPDLADTLSAQERPVAQARLLVPAVRQGVGPWRMHALAVQYADALGVLMLEGTVLRTTTLGDRVTGHLFGPQDVIRPWADPGLSVPGPMKSAWTVLTPTVFAPLDRRFVAAAARWPALLIELANRKDLQNSRIGLQLSIARMPRIDDRLLLTFWRLGQRWGRVTPQGLLVPLPLTHHIIAALVGGARPPVSSALGQLARDGLLHRGAAGWLLSPRAIEQLEAPDAQPATA